MTNTIADSPKSPAGLARIPFYYGWVMMTLAAAAMVGTLPGRTQGLGLITEPLLKDLQIDRVQFAQMNLWATLIGALFCLGIGRMLDYLGSRIMLPLVAVSLGITVLMMSGTTSAALLFGLMILTRGFGQSALSVVSLTMVGQWFTRRLNLAMGIYSVVMSMGFMIAFPIVGKIIEEQGWRSAWSGIGWVLILGLAPLGFLLARQPDADGLKLEAEDPKEEIHVGSDFTWGEALRTPAFWVFALASSIYNLLASGIGLFNESILAERGFGPKVYYNSLIITAMTSLIGNFLGGWLTSKWSMNRLMALTMAMLTAALLAFPLLAALWHVYTLAAVMGVASGFVMVIFFSYWAKTYGRAHLGRIQGTAQLLTVLASAVGPLLLAKCHAITNSYASVFYALAGVVALFAFAAWFVRTPQRVG